MRNPRRWRAFLRAKKFPPSVIRRIAQNARRYRWAIELYFPLPDDASYTGGIGSYVSVKLFKEDA